MKCRCWTGAVILMATVLATQQTWGQAKPGAKPPAAPAAGAVAAPAAAAAKVAPKEDKLELDMLPGGETKANVPGAGKGEMGSKEEVEEMLRGEQGEKTGDLKKFQIKTDDDISTLEVGDLYKNEETAFKIVAIKRKTAKGGEFTAERIAGQSDPQRRWIRISGSGPQNIVTRTTLLDLYIQGGPFLHPLALCFIVTTILTVNGCLIYRRKAQCPAEFVEAAESALEQGDLAQFESLSKEAKGLMPFICRNMVRDFETSTIEDTRSRVEVATVTHINRLRIPIRTLNLIAAAAPLLGLLGTIVGMVLVFEGVAGTSGAAKASILAAGIRVKLFSTATALMVAIPALFIYFIFNQKLGVIIGECELINERFMHLLARIKRAAGEADGAGKIKPPVAPYESEQ